MPCRTQASAVRSQMLRFSHMAISGVGRNLHQSHTLLAALTLGLRRGGLTNQHRILAGNRIDPDATNTEPGRTMAASSSEVEEGLRRRGLGGEAEILGMAAACNPREPSAHSDHFRHRCKPDFIRSVDRLGYVCQR